ncbi:hypothetical protein CHI07_16950 [Paenibacillus sp. 7884-2]|nr:hypothetical protein CHI07_16950 [Paenibacillus sp. 7884-2]
MKGAFQTSREIFENPIWSDIPKFRIFFYIYGNAVFAKEGTTVAGMHLDRGQFLRSYRNLQEDLAYIENRSVKKYSLSVIKRKVDSLVKENRLKIEDSELGTLFTVVNYETYQGFDHYKNQNLERSENAVGTDLERSENNNNNVNKDKNDKKDIKKTSRSKLKFETHHMKLAELLFKKVKENNPNAKEPNLESWANTFRLMMESPKEKRSGKDIQDLILWSQDNHFWYKNILSADKLRKQFDRLFMEMKDERDKPIKNNVIQIPNYGGERNGNGTSDEQHSKKFGDVKLYK